MIQVIVYSKATGRVRRVVDPQVIVPNVISFLNQVPIHVGEARLVFNKSTTSPNDLLAWQAAVNAHTGLAPDTNKNDWYCGVDGSNNILWWNISDPACGDSAVGLTLINAPWGADSTWTYDGVTFTPPPVLPKPTA